MGLPYRYNLQRWTLSWLLLFLYSAAANSPEMPPMPESSDTVECRDVNNSHDKCNFIHTHCASKQGLLIDFLSAYYCHPSLPPVLTLLTLLLWHLLLFSAMATAASDFLSTNLETIARRLRINENIAGVTIFAFGNGSSNLFSTLAAMDADSAGLAIGELFGAASFITAVVIGVIALRHEFKVESKSLVRDVAFSVVAVAVTLGVVADGEVGMGQCGVLVGVYVVYAVRVVGWHWMERRSAGVVESQHQDLVEDLAVGGLSEDDGERERVDVDEGALEDDENGESLENRPLLYPAGTNHDRSRSTRKQSHPTNHQSRNDGYGSQNAAPVASHTCYLKHIPFSATFFQPP